MERVKNMIYVFYFDVWLQTFNERKKTHYRKRGSLEPIEILNFIAHSYHLLNLLENSFGNQPNPCLRANVIASAFAQIPHKVVCRFDGKKPDTLGPNTRLYKWIRQNDLLGHPKSKAFITHGGANGIYEVIYHRIPMMGIYLFVHQPDNIAHRKTKGAAVRLDFNTMSSTDLLNTLKTVINDPSRI
ncbi:hypothetical protein HPG69_001445 [Diceros bicornis minor]|uniref:glucuronosyltransferase n=1 Tax=Diceros bicornis minor TaxID=77932 RepID=A0A7J7FGG5_DICBM|nr:hypothetical protein HPG69_001445 [Diceros bicornis minor]